MKEYAVIVPAATVFFIEAESPTDAINVLIDGFKQDPDIEYDVLLQDEEPSNWVVIDPELIDSDVRQAEPKVFAAAIINAFSFNHQRWVVRG